MKDDEQKRIFSKNLRRYMDIVNKPQSEVAKAIGVSPQTFNTWFNGIALPRMGKVQALADYFHCYKSDLIEDKPAAVSTSDGRAAGNRFSDDKPLHQDKSNGIISSDALHLDESNGMDDINTLLLKLRKLFEQYGTDTKEQRAALAAALDSLSIPDDKRELMKKVLQMDPEQAAAFLAFAKTVVKQS